MNQYRKLSEHRSCCVQNIQLLTKSCVELEDNSIIPYDVNKSYEEKRAMKAEVLRTSEALVPGHSPVRVS